VASGSTPLPAGGGDAPAGRSLQRRRDTSTRSALRRQSRSKALRWYRSCGKWRRMGEHRSKQQGVHRRAEKAEGREGAEIRGHIRRYSSGELAAAHFLCVVGLVFRSFSLCFFSFWGKNIVEVMSVQPAVLLRRGQGRGAFERNSTGWRQDVDDAQRFKSRGAGLPHGPSAVRG